MLARHRKRMNRKFRSDSKIQMQCFSVYNPAGPSVYHTIMRPFRPAQGLAPKNICRGVPCTQMVDQNLSCALVLIKTQIKMCRISVDASTGERWGCRLSTKERDQLL